MKTKWHFLCRKRWKEPSFKKIGLFFPRFHCPPTGILFFVVIAWGVLWGLKAPAQNSSLKTYGYFDLEAEVNTRDAEGKRWTFDQHHLNFLAIYTLDHRFRVFTELEWEHGVFQDSRTTRGRVYVARAFVEYYHSDALKLQAGKFLPPFGIYNEQHDATPTFLFTVLPISVYGTHRLAPGIQDRLFTKFITGLQVRGTLFYGRFQMDYSVYLGNGRGPLPDEQDNNANKGTGARIRILCPDERIKLGVSYYGEKNGNAHNLRVHTFGADAEVEMGNFLWQSELLLGRIQSLSVEGLPTGHYHTALGYYLQGAYSFWEKLTPFLRFDFFDRDRHETRDSHTDVVIGLNYSVSPQVYLKGEAHIFRYRFPGEKDYELFVTSVAVAF